MNKIVEKIRRFFRLFSSAVKESWEQLWKSFVLLVILTLILATIFYIYESKAQEEYASWLQSVIWSFFYYIEDPGGFGGNGPVTFVGKSIAIILSILNILIFAIPAGIIASGFTSALEADTKQKKLMSDCEAVEKTFKPVQCRHTMLRVVPAYKSVVSLQVQTGLNSDDIIGAVEYLKTDGLRLRNLADSYAVSDNAPDKLIVEYFPVTKGKSYGCCIDRGSNVTIVCPSSYNFDEIGDSHFGYMLAEFGGFNFVSREFDLENDASYYLLPQGVSLEDGKLKDPDSKLSPDFLQFFDDLKHLAEGKDKWVIFLMQFPRHLKSQICFVSAKQDGGSSVMDTQAFDAAYSEISDMLAAHNYLVNAGEKDEDAVAPLTCDLNESFKPTGKRNIGNVLGAISGCNAFTIRMASSLVARDSRSVPVAMRIAEILRRNLVAADAYITDNEARWKNPGITYPEARNPKNC